MCSGRVKNSCSTTRTYICKDNMITTYILCVSNLKNRELFYVCMTQFIYYRHKPILCGFGIAAATCLNNSERFEDIKVVSRCRKYKRDIHQNDQKKIKRQTMVQNTTQKTNDCAARSLLSPTFLSSLFPLNNCLFTTLLTHLM